jgi:hypothetical protein
MYRKAKEPPYSFTRADIPAMQVPLQLVIILALALALAGSYTDGWTVPALIYILVYILYGLDRSANLNIKVGSIFEKQEWIIRDHPSIARQISYIISCTAAVFWIPVIMYDRYSRMSLGEPLLAGGRKPWSGWRHAWRLWVVHSARSVDHRRLYNTGQPPRRILVLCWNLCTDVLVDYGRVKKLITICRIQEEEEVQVWQAALLIFNRPNRASVTAQYVTSLEVIKERHAFQMEYTGCKIRTVRSGLMAEELTGDLWPARVRRKGDEEGRTTKLPYNSHGIMVALANEASTADEARRKYHLAPDRTKVRIWVDNGICKARI